MDLTDAELGEIATELRNVPHDPSWARALAIGCIVLKRFFRGSVEEWRSHRRDKETSLRQLARRPDCPLGKSALCDAVAIYAVKSELPSFVDALTPSHVALALRLSAPERDRVLERAVAGSWSVRRLRRELLLLPRREGVRRLRARSTKALAARARIKTSVTAVTEACDLLREPDPIDHEAATSLWEALGELEARLAVCRESIASLDCSGEHPGLRSGPHLREVVPASPAQERDQPEDALDQGVASG